MKNKSIFIMLLLSILCSCSTETKYDLCKNKDFGEQCGDKGICIYVSQDDSLNKRLSCEKECRRISDDCDKGYSCYYNSIIGKSVCAPSGHLSEGDKCDIGFPNVCGPELQCVKYEQEKKLGFWGQLACQGIALFINMPILGILSGGCGELKVTVLSDPVCLYPFGHSKCRGRELYFSSAPFEVCR